MTYEKNSEKDHNIQLQFLDRLTKIPVIQNGLYTASGMYVRIKNSNDLLAWGLQTAQSSVYAAFLQTLPAVELMKGPLQKLDSMACHSLDIVEKRVPSLKLPPEMLLGTTKDYLNSKVVLPMKQKADYVKQLSLLRANDVLTSRYTDFAAEQINNALSVADKYVDIYLPDNSVEGSAEFNDNGSKAEQTVNHVDRLSRKLGRRITKRTLAETEALKQQAEDTWKYLISVMDVILKNPNASRGKIVELWNYLSNDGTKNQEPPANLEQLTKIFDNDLSRRFVQLINYTRNEVESLPNTFVNKLQTFYSFCSGLADDLMKVSRLEPLKDKTFSEFRLQIEKFQNVLKNINNLSTQLLMRVTSTVSRKHNEEQNESSLNESSQNESSNSCISHNSNNVNSLQ